MSNILISWLAFNNDFESGGKVIFRNDGPTGAVHSEFLEEYDKHIMLLNWLDGHYTSDIQEYKELKLKSYLKESGYEANVELRHVNVQNITDVNEIRGKMQDLLQETIDDNVELFISPGTPAMQCAWYLLSLDFPKVRLFQTIPGQFRKGPIKREYVEVKSDFIQKGLVIRQHSIEKHRGFRVTDSIRPIYELAEKIGATDSTTALVFGASGTGKEHISRHIHKSSVRGVQPFIAVNCSALGDELLESRLFGYKKGAFTGANDDRNGVFRDAAGGTVFLDEIGDISSYMQQVLLRVLQEREVTPVGSTESIKVDVRIIAATNRDLLLMCEQGEFRWDLYYRLAIAELELPSLVTRGRSEIQEMLEYFLTSKKKEFARFKKLKLSKEAKDILLGYDWPGNIREMENLVTRLYVYCDEQVAAADLPERITNRRTKTWLLKTVEQQHINKAIQFFGGNKSKVSEELGIAYNTLQARLREQSSD